MLKEGIFLGKRYEILGRIGSGGMADVYKGKDHKLNRFVAIKVLKSDYRTDEMFIQKFLSEAQAAAGLMHPNVVNVYDVGQDRGLYYMVMELVEGITLKDYIEKKGRLTAKETISISIQMVTGIQAAHNQHIIHRDIKPQNIIISTEGKVKVTDFGIARATTSTKTISTSVMGSVHYTSPEQARGGIVDEKSDIYSAGITMYEMVTGHVPFDGDSTVSVAIKHLQENIVSPAEEVPDIPYSLECIIMKCTQKNPERRYPNCQALILDLKRSLVNPEGDFVNSSVYATSVDDDATMVMSTSELERVKDRRYPADDEDGYEDDSYEDDEYEDDYEYDDDYSDSRNGYRPEEEKSDVDPNTKKITKILMIVAAVIVAFAVIFMAGKAAGIFKAGPSKVQEETQTRKVRVPNVVGKSKEEATKILNKKNLGIHVVEQKASDKYREGMIISQDPGEDAKVEKNTEVKVVISLGAEEKNVKVPDVTGQDEEEAQNALEKLKLTVDFEYEFNDSVKEGQVISTSPKAGASVKAGSKVVMTVSKGADKIQVPQVVGSSQSQAENALASAGLTVGSVTEEYSQEEAGTVISQSVEAGKKVAKGTSVNIVVSKGKKVEMETVPSLNGQTESDARSRIEAAGFVVGNISYESSNSVMEGYVIYQSASGGTQLEKGSTIDFVVSTGPEIKEPEPKPEPTEPEVKPDKKPEENTEG